MHALTRSRVCVCGRGGVQGKDLALDFAMDVLTGIPHDKVRYA